jgi:hypothetical protein
MTLSDLQREAELKATEVEINWDIAESKFFVEALEQGTLLIPDLESLYTKLTSGKSVVSPGQESSLSYEDKEKYADMIADQLFEAYVVREVLHKYKCITNIMNLAYPHDTPKQALDNPPTDQLDLGI